MGDCLYKLEERFHGKHVEGSLDSTESLGHIQSAYCLGQVDTARAAHNRCAMQLQHYLNEFKTENSTLEFITLEAEQSFKTLWEKHVFGDVCSYEEFEEECAACERQLPSSEAETKDMMQQLQNRMDPSSLLWEVCSICGESTRMCKDHELEKKNVALYWYSFSIHDSTPRRLHLPLYKGTTQFLLPSGNNLF